MTIEDIEDPRRISPPRSAPETETLQSWLDWHRMTLLLKVEGLDDEQRRRRPVGTSLVSLHGLVRHLADVERHWFQRVFLCQEDLPSLYWTKSEPEADWAPLDHADWPADLDAWQEQCRLSRAAAAGRDLDEIGRRRDEEYSLRWIYVHMIEEYARHNGHADLLRELIDGRVGG